MLHQVLNIFHLLGILVLQKSSKILLCVSLEVEPGPCPKPALLCPDCSSLVSASPPFPDQQLFESALWNSGKVMEAGVYSLQTRNTGHRKDSVPRSPTGSCLVSPPTKRVGCRIHAPFQNNHVFHMYEIYKQLHRNNRACEIIISKSNQQQRGTMNSQSRGHVFKSPLRLSLFSVICHIFCWSMFPFGEPGQ